MSEAAAIAACDSQPLLPITTPPPSKKNAMNGQLGDSLGEKTGFIFPPYHGRASHRQARNALRKLLHSDGKAGRALPAALGSGRVIRFSP